MVRIAYLGPEGTFTEAALLQIMAAGLGPEQIQNMPRTNKPAPLVPRRLVHEIDERIDYKGAEVVPLDEAGVRQAVQELQGLKTVYVVGADGKTDQRQEIARPRRRDVRHAHALLLVAPPLLVLVLEEVEGCAARHAHRQAATSVDRWSTCCKCPLQT